MKMSNIVLDQTIPDTTIYHHESFMPQEHAIAYVEKYVQPE